MACVHVAQGRHRSGYRGRCGSRDMKRVEPLGGGIATPVVGEGVRRSSNQGKGVAAETTSFGHEDEERERGRDGGVRS